MTKIWIVNFLSVENSYVHIPIVLTFLIKSLNQILSASKKSPMNMHHTSMKIDRS